MSHVNVSMDGLRYALGEFGSRKKLWSGSGKQFAHRRKRFFTLTKHQTLQNLNRNTISSLSSAASEAGKYTQIRPSINVRLDLTAKYTLHWVEVIKWHMSHVSSLARHSSFPAPRENCAFILSKPSLSLSAKHSLYFNCIIDTKIGQKST